MKVKRKKINTKKERVINTDVLPFETPITYTNKYFSSFLIKNCVEFNEEEIIWKKVDTTLDVIVRLIFGYSINEPIVNKTIEGKHYRSIKINFATRDLNTIPFTFKISHKEKDFRELTIAHPKNQLAIINFYHKYKEMILYYCNISPFSIRKPHKVAKVTYFKDKAHLENLAYDHESDPIEEFSKEYENLKTFFAYKEYSNIYKFYESYKYHRCEKKYNKLLKFDIAKCFDSIYTHVITWAVLNKSSVKDNINSSFSTFGGKFDTLMQNLNYGETNGIIIGPEFSRIFAEVIMQKIDFNVMNYLLKEKRLVYKKDYQIFRYVDDIFVFFNDDVTKEEIQDVYKHQLKEFKLYINDSKTKLYEKPIITEITIAKQKVAELLDKSLDFKTTLVNKENEDGDGEKKHTLYFSSNKTITKFKTIIKETNVAYKDIMNYTLACIDKKILKLIKTYSEIENKNEYELKFTKSAIELLDFTFFLYCVSPKVNTTIKLCLILSRLIKFSNIRSNLNHDNKHLIYKKIFDDVSLVLSKNKSTKYVQVETLYLLTVLKNLGKEYRLDKGVLCDYLNIDLDNKKCKYPLNYFSIIMLLFYIEEKSRYKEIQDILKDHIKNKFEISSEAQRRKSAELIFLLFDLLSCPFLDISYKKELLDYYQIDSLSGKKKVVNYSNRWFTKWDNFDFGMELESKRGQEVY